MSSWKKAGKSNQKTHRERQQPESRKHLGLLEKKKDYKLRANDRAQKEKTLKVLHKRALNKNPDEFYHHMINSKINEGEHFEKGEKDESSKEQVALMRTQDIKYITMKRTIESNKIKRLQSQLHMIDVANEFQNKHIFFLDDGEQDRDFDLAERLGTHPDLVSRKTNRPRLEDLDKFEIPDLDDREIKALETKRENAYKELNKRVQREKELTIIQQKLDIKKALSQKRLLPPIKIQKGTKESAPIYKFQYERKK